MMDEIDKIPAMGLFVGSGQVCIAKESCSVYPVG